MVESISKNKRLKVNLSSTMSNYQGINELKRIVKDKQIRARIIFYDTFIGSYKIRQMRPDNFNKGRTISSMVYEADEIARQRQETLYSLEKESENLVLDNLTEIANTLTQKDAGINQDGLYKELARLKQDSSLIIKTGEELERRMMNHKEKVIKDPNEKRRIARIFDYEANYMSKAVSKILYGE